MSYPVTPPETRFWDKVDKNGPLPVLGPDLGPCWLWTARTCTKGYGMFWDGEKQVLSHRWAFEHSPDGEPIPDGLTVDHLCFRKTCQRKSHLQAITRVENIIRGGGKGHWQKIKIHCPQGHPYVEENIYRHDGRRHCLACSRLRKHQKVYARPT